jgi:hypothetical protein
MRHCVTFFALALAAAPLCAQHRSGSPPTAPARPPVAVSTGLGPIQFAAVDYGVPAPQSLTRQMRSDDDRTRAAALSAVGVPGQYLQHGRAPMPRSIALDFVQLGPDDDLDAILTLEMDQHIVSAILIPDGDNWRRIATVFVADPFSDPTNTVSTFVRTDRSLLAHGRYSATFRATAFDGHGSMTENQAQLMVINKRAVITTSFVSAARDCSAASTTTGRATAAAGCNVVIRYLESDTADPLKHFTLVSASGHLSTHEATGQLGSDPIFIASHVRNFSCQPFVFSDQSLHFEPSGNSAPCPAK